MTDKKIMSYTISSVNQMALKSKLKKVIPETVFKFMDLEMSVTDTTCIVCFFKIGSGNKIMESYAKWFKLLSQHNLTVSKHSHIQKVRRRI
jgi:hypothetical protein